MVLQREQTWFSQFSTILASSPCMGTLKNQMNMALPDIPLLAAIGVLTIPLPVKALPEAQQKAIRVIKTQQWRKNNPAQYNALRKRQNRKCRARQRAWTPARRAQEAKRHRTWAIANKAHLRAYRNEWNKRNK